MIGVDHPLVQGADWSAAAAMLLAGVVAARWSKASSVLLLSAGVAWVLGGLLPAALFWHRGLLVHLLLAHPGWRPPSRPTTAVVVMTYAVSVLAPTALLVEPVTVGLALLVPAAAAWDVRRARGVRRYHRLVGLTGSGVLAGALVGGSLLRQVPATNVAVASLLLYEVAVVSVVAIVLVGLRPQPSDALTDLVVDLGDQRSPSLRDTLARTLRDPDLRLGFWDWTARAHLDESGRPVGEELPDGRAPVRIHRDGQPVALLVLDSSLVADPEVIRSLEAATRVTAVNDQRQAEVLADLHELDASRRRLLAVGDDERRRLERELRAGVVGRLEELADRLREVPPGPSSPHVSRGLAHLEQTIDDLNDIAAGLQPSELAHGLRAALSQLADRMPMTVTVTVTGEDGDHHRKAALAPAIQLTVWYLCAEALTNTAKHAPGASVAIELSYQAEMVRVRVGDDGPGGAVVHGGGGLLGLRDRVQALSGRLEVRSSSDGTELLAELPLTPPGSTAG